MKPIRNREQQRGMTLAEVLVAMAIFAIIFVAALMIYDQSNKVFKTGVESAELQQNTRVAFDKMLSEIRMAGYDYDRDGFPTAAGEAQQPDEQIEFAGPGAITFRANLNFDEADTDGGRVQALETPNSQFPVVTTGNDEIVTYALESQTGANPDTITFYADVTDGSAAARQTFPGGSAEDKIEINGVDLCVGGCNDPPYTLLRITLDEKGNPIRTPLANNIRSMNLQYFSDATGTTALAIADAGGGQYNPANPDASAAPRAVRARVRSVGATIIGMAEAPDFNYRDPDETLTTAPKDFSQHRKYRLESMIVARNMGKRGMKEQQTSPPGPPNLDRAYFGLCGAVTLEWTAPPNNAAFGSVESYAILWDTDIADTDNPTNPAPVGLATSYTLVVPDPTFDYRFTVVASNSWGTTPSNQFIIGQPLNATQPDSASDLVASGAGAGGTPQPNQIELAWLNPATNVAGQDTLTCKTPGGGACTSLSGAAPHPAEARGIVIYRDTDLNFTANASTRIFETSGSVQTWTDTTAANCTDYYYRIQLVEYCAAAANQNTSNNTAQAMSPIFPAPGDAAIPGRAESYVKPSAPTNLTVVNAASSCPGGFCKVSLQWPEVVTDINGDSLAISDYRVYVTQNGTAYAGSPFSAIPSTGLTTNAGVAGYVVQGLPQSDAASVPFEYEFTVAALNCGTEGDESPAAKFPSCDFASGGEMVSAMASALAGDGSSAAPFEVESSGVISFSTTTSANLKAVSAAAYDIATNQLVVDLGSATGPAGTLNLVWPDTGDDDAIYRIDFVATDMSDCQTTGSLYVMNSQVSCPFVVPTTLTPVAAAAQFTDVILLNNIPEGIRIRGIEFDWDEGIAASIKDASILAVRFPVAPSGALDCGTYDCQNGTMSGSTQSTGTVTAVPAGTILNLPPSDQTGSYRIRIAFENKGNGAVTKQPVTRVEMTYRLFTDPASVPDRVCTVLP